MINNYSVTMKLRTDHFCRLILISNLIFSSIYYIDYLPKYTIQVVNSPVMSSFANFTSLEQLHFVLSYSNTSDIGRLKYISSFYYQLNTT